MGGRERTVGHREQGAAGEARGLHREQGAAGEARGLHREGSDQLDCRTRQGLAH